VIPKQPLIETPCPGTKPKAKWAINFDRFGRLHPDGRTLIEDWLNRAVRLHASRPNESFEPFIFMWIAYNGWAACVSRLDGDSEQNEAMASSPQLCAHFKDRLMNDPALSDHVRAFYAFWPIFSAKDIRSA
jgi:hypothetical protein